MSKKNKKSQLFILFLLLFFLLGAFFVFAQERELEINYPIIPGVEVPATVKIAFPVYVKYIFNLAIMIAGIVAFLALVIGGVRYLASGGSPSTQKDASGQIAAAFFSLIILLSSYLILFTIDPRLVIFNLPNIQSIPTPIISPQLPEDKPYVFQEIPTGYFVEKVLEKEKLDKIESLSKDLKDKVGELKTLADELKALTEKCKCANTTPNCSNCDYWQPCPCTACQGDPCPNRTEINQKKEQILTKVKEIRELKDKLKEQKEILVKDLANLEKAEKLMVECFGNPINYENLVIIGNILNIKVEKYSDWSNLQIPQDQANFYCKK